MSRFIRAMFLMAALHMISFSAFAYTDRIDAPVQEIYNAAKKCFQNEGIYKENDKQLSLTTRWIYTRIRRSRSRRFVPIQLKENVDLRYQMQIDVEEGKNYSSVSVRGWFQEKGTDAPAQQPWKNSYSSKELYFKEREAFFKILKCLETQKKEVTMALSSTSS